MAFRIPVSQKNGSYHFPDLQYSSRDFYNRLGELIDEYQFPDVQVGVSNYSEGGLFSSKREYLCIYRKGYQFDVCAAAFGKSFFVSWWLTETKSKIPGVLSKIPVFGSAMAKQAESKTFFQVDTETMFKDSIYAILKTLIEEICNTKGIRIPEDERALPIVA